MSNWVYQDFSYISKDPMSSRRAAHLLYDFLNMFDIEKFHIIASFGEWQNQSITIVYKEPLRYKTGEVEEKWYRHIKTLTTPVDSKVTEGETK